jgi:hypothetical protein
MLKEPNISNFTKPFYKWFDSKYFDVCKTIYNEMNRSEQYYLLLIGYQLEYIRQHEFWIKNNSETQDEYENRVNQLYKVFEEEIFKSDTCFDYIIALLNGYHIQLAKWQVKKNNLEVCNEQRSV